MKRNFLTDGLLASLCFLSMLPAQAHRPYAVKEYTIQGPNKQTMIVEKLFGDGIFYGDPVRLQIRNQQGAVIAHSKTATHVGVFCPSIQFCWAFPYNDLLVEPLLLDYEKLQYNASDVTNQPEALADYLSGAIKVLRDDRLGYPSYRDTPQNFSTGSPLIKLLSPIIIIANSFLTFLGLAVIYFLPSLLLPLGLAFCLRRTGFKKVCLILIGILLAFAYTAFVLMASLVILFTLSTPLVYSVVVAGGSVWTGTYLSKKLMLKGLAV
jgi:hypothetical protein